MIKNSLISPTIGAQKVKQPVNDIVLSQPIMDKIKQRRLQMLVHSYIYYELGTSIIPDARFDKWAYELKDLQNKYPAESQSVKYYQYFRDWDGTTGFNLPYMVVKDRAEWLLQEHKNANK